MENISYIIFLFIVVYVAFWYKKKGDNKSLSVFVLAAATIFLILICNHIFLKGKKNNEDIYINQIDSRLNEIVSILEAKK